jgi:hypothetical protein
MRRANLLTVAALAALSLGAGACHSSGDAVVVVVVTASGTPPPVSSLSVTITAPSGTSSTQAYTRSDGQPIAFPTTLAADLPANATGTVSIGVSALGATGATVAAAPARSALVSPGGRPTVYVQLDCGGPPCQAQGGGADGGADASSSPRCGNGRIDPGEVCDTAIPPGDPGACPTTCDDGVTCTIDTAQGSGCQLSCKHVPITGLDPNDGCCPVAGTHETDPDCSPTCGNQTVDPGETCDIGIDPGLPGACPPPGECTSTDPCVLSQSLSAGTCQAICMHYPVTKASLLGSDGCCPPGATSATDTDCAQSCGDGVVETNENCDVAIKPPAAGSCPTSCRHPDAGACQTAFLTGTGCTVACFQTAITTPISGDGCCPPGATRATDSDCLGSCGDGIVDPGESCDPSAVGPGACPTSCPPSPSACVQTTLTGSATACTAACVSKPIVACSPQSDGCCPSGCTAADDPDCSTTCGDGKVQSDETCDVAIPAGGAGACPQSCNDGNSCTTDLLLSSGTCEATCLHLQVTAFIAGDGCCPPGGDLNLDADCAALCGDGIVEPPVESCDKGIAGSCPVPPTSQTSTTCPAADACTQVTVEGSPSTCTSRCVYTPITACVGGDRCCPAGCTSLTDSDCVPICGDGVVQVNEQCDRAITAGMPGACQRTCDDGDACTTDIASGSTQNCTRRCTHLAIVACLDDDGCCPTGCMPSNDSDCMPVCGDGHVGNGETCDPPSTCPTTCPDDGDPCTTEVLVGNPLTCNAACRHVPITTCSTAGADHCCPTGCTSATDSDC